jgi:hypothetical protein
MPRMDIQSGVIALVILAVIFAILSVRGGLLAIRSARKMTFYRLRRQRESGGWRMIGLAALLVAFAVFLPLYGLPIAYEFFPPTPTASVTPTITIAPSITLSPTITLTPTVTDTALVTDTPTITPTPSLPLAVLALFQSSITPNPDSVFSPLVFSTRIDNDLQPIDPETVFQNPIREIFATYSYAEMLPGAQWTAVWLRDGQQVCLETKPFDGGTGGYGFANCSNPAGGWQPGIYEARIFVGEEWKVIGRFLVQGNPPTAIPTATLTPSTTPTLPPSRTPTLTPSATSAPTLGTPATPTGTP